MKRYKGKIQSGPNTMGQRYSIIEYGVSDSDKKMFHFVRGYICQIKDFEGKIILKSRKEGGFLSRVFGTADLVYYKDDDEILRISYLKTGKFPWIKYQSKKYDYNLTTDQHYRELITDEFNIKLDSLGNKIVFECKDKYLLECICCSVEIWRDYLDFT